MIEKHTIGCSNDTVCLNIFYISINYNNCMSGLYDFALYYMTIWRMTDSLSLCETLRLALTGAPLEG